MKQPPPPNPPTPQMYIYNADGTAGLSVREDTLSALINICWDVIYNKIFLVKQKQRWLSQQKHPLILQLCLFKGEYYVLFALGLTSGNMLAFPPLHIHQINQSVLYVEAEVARQAICFLFALVRIICLCMNRAGKTGR